MSLRDEMEETLKKLKDNYDPNLSLKENFEKIKEKKFKNECWKVGEVPKNVSINRLYGFTCKGCKEGFYTYYHRRVVCSDKCYKIYQEKLHKLIMKKLIKKEMVIDILYDIKSRLYNTIRDENLNDIAFLKDSYLDSEATKKFIDNEINKLNKSMEVE